MGVEPDFGLCIWNGSGGADQRRSGGSAYLLRRPGPQTSGAGIDGAFDPYHDHGQPDLAPVGAAGPKQGRPLPVSVPAGTGCQLGARQTSAPFFGLLWHSYFLAVLYAPNRVWFVEVEGNGSIPDRQILAAAEECGVKFWAKAGEIRSEQVKNKILNLVPELQWAGVNFSGGVAIVSVRERLPEEAVRDRSTVTNVVAARDGVIVSMSVFRRSIGVSGWAGGPGRGAFGDGLRRPNNAYPVHPCRCGDLCADSADDTGGLSPNCSAKGLYRPGDPPVQSDCRKKKNKFIRKQWNFRCHL